MRTAQACRNAAGPCQESAIQSLQWCRPVIWTAQACRNAAGPCQESAIQSLQWRWSVMRTAQACRNAAGPCQESAIQSLQWHRSARFQQTRAKKPADLLLKHSRPAPRKPAEGISPAAFPQNRPSVRSAKKRGRHYGRNGRFRCRVSRKTATCAFWQETWPALWQKWPFPLPRFRKIGLLCVLARNAAGEAGWGVHEGIGGKGDARGPCARSGAALQHDGVRSRTVRHAEGAAKRDALAVKRLFRL